MFVIVTRRSGFAAQWQAVFEKHGEAILRLESMMQLESRLHMGGVKLAVIDFALDGSSDPATLRRLRQQGAAVRLLAAGTTFTPQAELATLAAGVVAACDLGLRHEEMVRIVDVVLQGGIWISRAGIPLLVGKLQSLTPRPAAITPVSSRSRSLEALTPREREVAEMVSQGASNKTIGEALDISDRTVKSHLTTIFGKLGITDRLQLALHMTSSKKDAPSMPPTA